MATYKKRGYKPKKEKTKTESTTAEVFDTLDQSASRVERWVAKNQQFILIGISVVALGVLIFLGYREFVQKPTQIEANNQVYQAQQYFEQALSAADADSLYNLALEGDGDKYGFLDIIEKYPRTKAANLAKYASGMAYLNMNDYEKAIEYLSKFSSETPIIGAKAKGGIGDAFAQLDQAKEALEYYQKAIDHSDNDYTAPLYMMKAGQLALSENDSKKALMFFQKIKENYPKSSQARNIDVYIGKASVAK